MEKISDEELSNLQYFVIPLLDIHHWLDKKRVIESLQSIVQELKERREAEATCKKSLQVEEMIKSLKSISETFLLASVNKNNKIEGCFSGDESKLLSIVDFVFDKLEEASNGEITKRDLIGELLSAEGGD